MRATHQTRQQYATPFTRPESPSLLVQALASTITGRPLPDAVRPPTSGPATPATARAGIARILAGPRD